MSEDRFNKAPFSPFSNNNHYIYPGNKGLLLFYNDGNIYEKYDREHAMMMQDIGYWYIDNWQGFLLNYSYNGVVVMMIEFDTSIVYLPKYITKEQDKSLINYLENNILDENKSLLKFYIMRCLDINNEEFSGIERDSRGMIKKIDGIDITGEKAFGYDDFCKYLNNNLEEYNTLKK